MRRRLRSSNIKRLISTSYAKKSISFTDGQDDATPNLTLHYKRTISNPGADKPINSAGEGKSSLPLLSRHNSLEGSSWFSQDKNSCTQTETEIAGHSFKPNLRKLAQTAFMRSFVIMLIVVGLAYGLQVPSWFSGFFAGITLNTLVVLAIIYVYYKFTHLHPTFTESSSATSISDIFSSEKHNIWVKIAINDSAYADPIPVFMSLVDGYLSFYYPSRMSNTSGHHSISAVKTLDLSGGRVTLSHTLPRWKYWINHFPIELGNYKVLENDILKPNVLKTGFDNDLSKFHYEEWRSVFIFFENGPAKETWFYRLKDGCKIGKHYHSRTMKPTHGGLIPKPGQGSASQRKQVYHLKKIFKDSDNSTEKAAKDNCPPDMVFMNTLMKRMSVDLTKSLFWKKVIARVVEKKIFEENVPYFVDGIKIASIDFGMNSPVIQKITPGEITEGGGLSMYIDISYEGGMRLLSATKLNVIRLLKHSEIYNKHKTGEDVPDEESIRREIACLIDPEKNSQPDKGQSQKSVRLYSRIAKVIDISGLQKLVGTSPVTSVLQRLSSTPMTIQVTVERLSGKLVVHIPEPPSDRIWFAFVDKPVMDIAVRPQVGSTWLNIDFICDFITHWMKYEVMGEMLLPKMDNIFVPIIEDRVKRWLMFEHRENDEKTDSNSTNTLTESFVNFDGKLITDEDVNKFVDFILY